MASLPDFAARIRGDNRLARYMRGPASSEDLATLRARTLVTPLGLVDVHTRFDGCRLPGGVMALLSPILDRGMEATWTRSARWLSIVEGEQERESVLRQGFELADTDVVVATGKAPYTWLVADRSQVVRALYWRMLTPSHRVRVTPTAQQTWPEFMRSFCAAKGTFELQDRGLIDRDEDQTLLYVSSARRS